MENNTGNNAENNINLTDDEAINLFVEGLMEEKGIELGDEPYKSDIFVDLKNRLLVEIDRSLISALPDEKLDMFNAKVEKGEQIDPKEMATAIADSKIDVEKVVAITMARFRDLYLGSDDLNKDEE